MHVRSVNRPRVNLITLGCSKNLVDSENLYTQLKANDFDVHHERKKDDSDIVIINTCGFIDLAKQESIDTILRFADEKEAGRISKLYVTGCLSQRYKDDLEQEIPAVDAYFGTMELPSLLKTLEADYKHELLGERAHLTPAHYAYLKISEGCDRPCSFCAIPLMRGKHVSVPVENLVAQARNLAKHGVKELLLIAQDSTYYGLDIYGERKLAHLLENLSGVAGIDWIRLHYAFPSQFPADVPAVMREKSNICKYLDMPLQHVSDNMLKVMRRGITRRRTIELVEKLKNEIPGLALRTTMLVGHPGETEKDFRELVDFIKQGYFERLGVFTYSHEENTHAHTMADDVPQELKEDRAAEIMEIQQEISLRKNEALLGRTLKVLFDRVEGNFFVGRTEYDSPEVDNEVMVDKRTDFVRVGDFANIRIERAEEFDLFGTVAQN